MPKRIYDWDVVQAYYDEGHGFVQCAHRFGFCHTAWIKAIKRGALRAQSRFRDRRRKYNWAEVQGYYDLGHSYRDCRTRFGFFAAAWSKAVRRVEIKPRNATKPIAEVLGSKSSRCRKKAKLVREGYLPHRCLECGISDWRGERLAISRTLSSDGASILPSRAWL